MKRFDIDETLELFAKLLEERFSKGLFTNEDTIRYTFFYCLSKCEGIEPSDIILEQPHPLVPRAEVDLYLPSVNGKAELVIEFKFDRAIPSERNLPRPQKAGKIFADIMRLACFTSNPYSQLYLVYVTDTEMATYFSNPDNRLDDFFNLLHQETLLINQKYINRHCETFVKSVGNTLCPSQILCRLSKKFASKMWLRVYEIKPLA